MDQYNEMFRIERLMTSISKYIPSLSEGKMLILALHPFGFPSDCSCIDTPISELMLIHFKLACITPMIFLALMLPNPFCLHDSEDQHEHGLKHWTLPEMECLHSSDHKMVVLNLHCFHLLLLVAHLCT